MLLIKVNEDVETLKQLLLQREAEIEELKGEKDVLLKEILGKS